jgi:hypothetical protein
MLAIGRRGGLPRPRKTHGSRLRSCPADISPDARAGSAVAILLHKVLSTTCRCCNIEKPELVA